MSPTPKAQRLRDRLSMNPDEPPPPPARPAPPTTLAPPPVAISETSTEAEQPLESSEPAPQPARRAPTRRRGRRRPPTASTPAHLNAVDDPSITPGRKDYRSFYIEDATFARFRAAIYWLARREDAAGEVPENMSVAVETWMQETADELERRYNDGETFRMPVSRRRRSTS